jgi:hypothetical protein
MFRKPLPPSVLVLAAVAMLDLVTTLLFLKLGFREGNPLFAWLFQLGVGAFISGKVVLLAIPIMLLQYARQFNAKSAEQGTWLAVVFYCAFYALSIAHP